MRGCRLLLFVAPQRAASGPILFGDIGQDDVNGFGRAVEGFTRYARYRFNELTFLLMSTTSKYLYINRGHGIFLSGKNSGKKLLGFTACS
jgi:hypothetical protein